VQAKLIIFSFLLITLLTASCKKASSDLYTDNDPPAFSAVPAVKVRNFVNRAFIDLIGREPTDVEMEVNTASIQSGNSNMEAREALIDKLMSDTTFRDGDTSYTLAYHKRIYDLGKIRFMDGVSEAQLIQQADIYRSNAISDSLSGNISGYEEAMMRYSRMKDLLLSARRYMLGEITIQQQFAVMINNAIYDIINMNSFNFVNACFNELFYRFPSNAEFLIAYSMVEDNQPGVLFNATAQNKDEFVNILTQSQECRQGIIIWSYQTILARNPISAEIYDEMLLFGQNGDFKAMQKRLLKSAEYANF
jgi:hypothetical protein